MLIDTGVLIWATRGHADAQDALNEIAKPAISIVTVIELMQGARDKREMRDLENSLERWGPEIVDLDAAISQTARDLIRSYSLSGGLQLTDALIAASAVSRGLILFSGNRKHFEGIEHLEFKTFIPA